MKKTKIMETVFFPGKLVEELTEKGEPKWVISGPFTVVDTPNKNNRIYPKETMNRAIDKLRKKVAKKCVKMSLDHPEWEGKLSDSAAILMEVSDVQEDGMAYYKAQIIDTAKGKDLKAILAAGGVVGVSTRGFGDAKYDQEWPGLPGRYSVISDGFELTNIDFVDGPSVEKTEDEMQLESTRRSENEMKTIAELRKEFPEAFVDLDKQIEEQTASIATLTAESGSMKDQLMKVTEMFKKLGDSFKVMFPDLFTTVPETDITKAQDSKIEDLTKKLAEAEVAKTEATKKIEAIETEKVLAEKNSALAKLRADDPKFFEFEVLTKRFESCNTAAEVQKVYESSKELLTSIIEKAGQKADKETPAAPKTGSQTGATLEGAQLEDFNLKNQARRDSDLPPMTAEAYLKLVK